MSFHRVLVANRGEIACRILRTLDQLGLETAVVYSEADRGAPHVALAGRARCIGAPPAERSYLDQEAVLAAARELGCDAVHPGYGFLSENAAFAAACEQAGLVFIGPAAESIRLMGDKAEARKLAIAAGVAPTPGHEGDDGGDALRRAAQKLGFPLLVKAAKGGGGKGMRRVDRAGDLDAAIVSARREAKAAFGDGTLLLEKLVHPARHVEVQLLGDHHGRVIALLERECSLQRRHQKVIEECPSPAVGPELRRRLGEAAVRLARTVGYRGAGTIEFLLDEDERFYFLEMNTRLQVEHGVTELVTGVDLVAWQVRIARGEPLTLEEPAGPFGHAIEARVYAEDPASGFLPQSGRLHHIELPAGPGVRVDSGIRAGQEVTPYYDPLLMKVMAHGTDREEARRRLVAALRATLVAGPATNLPWLAALLEGSSFRSGRTFTTTLEEEPPIELRQDVPEPVRWLLAWALERRAAARPDLPGAGDGADLYSPFDGIGRFRLVEPGSSS